MAAKKFSMNSVLRFRKQQEDIFKQRYIEKQQKEAKVSAVLQGLQEEQSQLASTLAEKQNRGIIASDLARYDERIVYIRQQIEITRNELKRKQEAVEKARKALLEKSKEHKALETLKEKQDKAWLAFLNKKEALMLDEIAVLRHGRVNNNNN